MYSVFAPPPPPPPPPLPLVGSPFGNAPSHPETPSEDGKPRLSGLEPLGKFDETSLVFHVFCPVYVSNVRQPFFFC